MIVSPQAAFVNTAHIRPGRVRRVALVDTGGAAARSHALGRRDVAGCAGALMLRPRVLIEAASCGVSMAAHLASHNAHQARRVTMRTAMVLDDQLIETGLTERVLHPDSRQARETQTFISGATI